MTSHAVATGGLSDGRDKSGFARHHAAGRGWLLAFSATAMVIVTSAAVLLARLLSTFSFLNDDLVQFDVANRTGFSLQLLLLNVFQHFGPVNRALHFLLFSVGELDPDVGAVLSVLLVVGLLSTTAWLAAELGLSLPRRLLILIATGGSLSLLDTAVWADASLHILPALIATYLVVALQLRAIRTGHWGWWLCAIAVFSAGLLTQERAGFALPLAVLVDVLLLWRDDPWRQRFQRLWTLRIPLFVMTAIGTVAAALIYRNYVTPGAGQSSLAIAAQTTLAALTSAQFPQLFGVQPADTLGLGWQLTVLLLIMVAAGGLVVVNRRNSGPVLFFFAVFLLYWGFLAFSPILNEAGISGTATRLHNAVYLTVPAYLAAFSLNGPTARRSRPATRPRWMTVGVLGLVFLLVTLAGNFFTATDWMRYRSAHQYWEGLTAARPALADQGITVVPIQAPESVADSWAVALGHQEFLFPLVEPGWQITALRDRTVIIDAGGELQNVALKSIATVLTGSEGSADGQSGSAGDPRDGPTGTTCLRPFPVSGSFPVVSAPAASAEPMFAKLSYTSAAAGRVIVLPSSAGLSAGSAAAVDVLPGVHEVLVPLLLDKVHGLPADDLPVEALQVSPTAGSEFCIEGLSIVTPVVVDPAGSCQNIDRYGARTGLLMPCPS